MTIQTNTTDRKAMANALAAHLGTTAQYLRTPTYAYQVGDYTINRDGSISGENLKCIQAFLAEHGYIEAMPAAAPEEQEAIETPILKTAEKDAAADSEASNLENIDHMDISIPMRDATPNQVKNLIFMLYSKQTLINHMTNSDYLNIPKILIDRLQENTPASTEEVISMVEDSKAVADLSGLDFHDGKISMTFPFDESQPTKWTTYADLLNRVYDTAMKATRVFPELAVPDDQNEKYLAHVWLQRLGFAGANFKAQRQILLSHLKGYCAFRNGEKMQAHKDKYAELRRQEREMRGALPADSGAQVTVEEPEVKA